MNGDGLLDHEDLSTSLQQLGLDIDADTLISKIDTTGSGVRTRRSINLLHIIISLDTNDAQLFTTVLSVVVFVVVVVVFFVYLTDPKPEHGPPTISNLTTGSKL